MTATLTEPGLVMTFDDRYVPQWLNAADIFERTGARVTFFVDQLEPPTAPYVAGLRELAAMGHAVGCHGLRHRKALDYADAHGIDRYIRDEIVTSLAILRDQGFTPTAFAYPSSQRDERTDRALLGHFRHLRYGLYGDTPLAEYDALFVPLERVGRTGLLPSRGMDGDDEDIAGLRAALQRVHQRRELLVLYAHCIGCPAVRTNISRGRLERILDTACDEGLSFYTMDDLP